MIACASLVATLPARPAAQQDGDQKQVLVIYAARRDTQIAVVGDRELPPLLEQGLPEGVDYYTEYLDGARFPDAGYREGFRDFLGVKYRGHRFDLVIAFQDMARDFVAAYRAELFPDTPLVFLASQSLPARSANTTGVFSPLDLSRTLTFAATLQPDVREVFVVSGAGEPDRNYERRAREQLRPFESRFRIHYLAGLPAAELEARLAALPDRSIVYFLLVYRDATGQNFHPLGYLDRVTTVANAPTYCWVSSSIDHGVVGGSLLNQTMQVQELAKVALRVLRGEAADSIPIALPDAHLNEVDWRQLRRWGIDESRLPAATVVHFRQPSLWDLYKAYIIAAGAIVLSQSALIAGLLVQSRRRRKAETHLRASQEELRTSYDRIRDMGGRLLGAQEAERARIARELHDDISQQMALLQIDLGLLTTADAEETPGLAGSALDRAHGIASSVHDLSHRLHPAKLRLIGLAPALDGLRRELSTTDLPITFAHEDVPSALPHEMTVCLFRVAQEALHNALKYGAARHMSMHLCGRSGDVVLTIVDDGRGFDAGAEFGKGLGLISMRERLETVGGTLAIDSRPGAGCRVEGKVPYPGGMAMRASNLGSTDLVSGLSGDFSENNSKRTAPH